MMDLKGKSVKEIGLWLDEEGFSEETIKKFEGRPYLFVLYSLLPSQLAMAGAV